MKRRKQPLKIAGPEAARTLPMDEFLASVNGAKLAFFNEPYEHIEPSFTAIEAALAKALFQYLTSDPSQRTFDNVRTVAAYMQFSFLPTSSTEWDRVSSSFDWELIHRVAESQMMAAYALAAMYAACASDVPPETKDFALEHSVATLSQAVSLHEALAVREKQIEGAQKRVQRDPKSAAMLVIHTEYLRWKEGHERFRSNTKFAMEMIRRYPIIESARSIENKCPQWERARRKESSS